MRITQKFNILFILVQPSHNDASEKVSKVRTKSGPPYKNRTPNQRSHWAQLNWIFIYASKISLYAYFRYFWKS